MIVIKQFSAMENNTEIHKKKILKKLKKKEIELPYDIAIPFLCMITYIWKNLYLDLKEISVLPYSFYFEITTL